MSEEKPRPSPDYRKHPKVFDFFCGCGGTSVGMMAAGMDIAFGLDNDRAAGQTFQANFPKAEFLCVDIQDLAAESIEQSVSSCADHPLVFSACAPCQPFSQQRRGAVSSLDKRLGLLRHLLRFVEMYRPEFLFVENVPGLYENGLGQGVFKPFTQKLHRLKYKTESRILRSQDYGVPQHRSRLVLLASLTGTMEFPHPTHGPGAPYPEYATVGDWIKDFPKISAGETHPDLPNHRAATLSALNLKRIQATPAGGGWQDLPIELVPECHKSDFTGYTDVYGRLRWDAPAPAMTTRCISYSNGRFGHPQQDRAISVREAAALQTFPNAFVFAGNLNSQARQVGNAVPALLAQRFGEAIIEHIGRVTAARTFPLQELTIQPSVSHGGDQERG